MTSNEPITNGYYNLNFGWVNSNNDASVDSLNALTTEFNQFKNKIDNTIDVTYPSIVKVGYNIENTNVTLGNGNPNTKTTIETQNLSVGRWIYMYSNNAYGDITNKVDSGLVLNVEATPDLSFNINGAGITTSTIHVDVSTGFLPTQLLAIQSEKNTCIVECLLHIGNVVTINTNPADSFSVSQLTPESANGKIRAVHVSILQSTAGTDTLKVGYSAFSNVPTNAVLYDTKTSGKLGTLELTATTNQAKLKNITINSADTVAHTLTIPNTTADDNFVLNNVAATLKNKTIIDNSNNVLSRGFWVNSGSGSVSTYSSAGPLSGQVLMANSTSSVNFQSLFTVTAGNGLTGGPGGGIGNNNITISKSATQDDTNKTTTTTGDPSNASPYTVNTPITLTVPLIVTGAFAGAVAAAGFVAGGFVAGIGGIGTNTINPKSGTTTTFPQNVTISGNLNVGGTLTTVNSANLSLASQYIYLNSNDSLNNVSLPTGLIATRKPGLLTYTLTNFTIGNISNAPQCNINNITSISVGNFIQVYSIDPLYSGTDEGYYEVLSVTAGTPNILKFRGTTTPCVVAWTKSNCVTDNTNTLYGVIVQTSGLEFATDSEPYYLAGNNADTLLKNKIAYNTSSPSFAGLTVTTDNVILNNTGNNNTVNKLLVLDGSDKVQYRNYSSILSSMYSTSGDILPINGSSTLTSIFYHMDNITTVMQLQYFTYTTTSNVNKLSIGTLSFYNTTTNYNTNIFLKIGGIWEECILYLDRSGVLEIFRKNASNFGNGVVIEYGVSTYINTRILLASITYIKTN